MAVLPKNGISQTLVKQTLGAGSYGVGALCTHANINMFSKYKPVRYPAGNVDSKPSWWKSSRSNCGINIPMLNNRLDAGSLNWSYERPEGGSAQPFRLGDFRGYDPGAYPILSPGFQEKYTVNKGSVTRISLPCMLASQSETNLYHGDILSPALSDLYFAVDIYRSGGARRASATASQPIRLGGSAIDIDIALFDSGDYMMYFYLADSKKLQNDPEPASVDYVIYHNTQYINPVPLTITATAPLRFDVLEIGYSLKGKFRSYSDFSGYALQSDGYVAFKVRVTGTGGFAAVDFRIKSWNWWGEEVKVYLANSIYDANKVKVNAVNLSSSGDNIFYIVANVFSIRNGASVGEPMDMVRMYAICEFQLVRGSVTNVVTLGMADFIAISSSMGMIVPDPGPSAG